MSNYEQFGGAYQPRRRSPERRPQAQSALPSLLAQRVEPKIRPLVEERVPSREYQHSQLEPFDPDSPTSSIDKWLVHFEELGERYRWSDYEKISLLTVKLEARARDWYRQVDLNTFGMQWNNWKKELWCAFVKESDFATDLEHLVLRKKLPNESLAAYFQEKMALCEKCEISGRKAVSCLIKGLSEDNQVVAYALNCESPHEFFEAMSQFEEQGADGAEESRNRKREYPPRRRRSDYARMLDPSQDVKCFACLEKGHIATGCPQKVCFKCGKVGHTRRNCWKKSA